MRSNRIVKLVRKSTLVKLLVLLILCSCNRDGAKEQRTLSDFRFESIFGQTSREPKSTFCILGSGFFRAPRSANSDSMITEWMKYHPNAAVVPVSSFGPVDLKNKESKLTYCWVIDGKDTLNNYLVRRGCFPGGTMERPKTWDEMNQKQRESYSNMGDKPNIQVHVDKKSYDAFMEQIKAADLYAQQNKLGIWQKGNDGLE